MDRYPVRPVSQASGGHPQGENKLQADCDFILQRFTFFLEMPDAPKGDGIEERDSSGIHGLTKVSLGPAMPYHSTPGRQPPLKRPYNCFKGGRRTPLLASLCQPLGYGHAVHY
jgi:hypothetical protein